MRRGKWTSRARGLVLVFAFGLVLAPPAWAVPGITGSVGAPSATTFGKTVTFSGTITNTGSNSDEAFTSFSVVNEGSSGLSNVTSAGGGPVAPGATAAFSVSARVSGSPGSTAQLALRVAGVTASGTVADPQNVVVGTAFTVSDAVNIVVSAERKRSGVYNPCVACSVDPADELRYAVTVTNLSDVAATDVKITAPTPSRTTNLNTSTIPSSPFTLPAGSSQTYFREVAVNDPFDDSGDPQPGDAINFSAFSSYDATSGSTSLQDESAAGSPATHFASVSYPRVPITNELSDVNLGAPIAGDGINSRVTVRNTGDINATGTVVVVSLTELQNPTNVRVGGVLAGDRATASPTQLTVRVGSGASSSAGGTLPPGGPTLEITFDAVVPPSGSDGGAWPRSQASVTFGNGGVSPRTADAALESRADLSAALAGVPATLDSGSFTATATLTNNGPATTDASDVPALTVSYDAGKLTAATPPDCTASTGSLRCEAPGALAPGQSFSVPVTFTRSAAGAAAITATTSGPQPDPQPGNNSVTATATSTPPADPGPGPGPGPNPTPDVPQRDTTGPLVTGLSARGSKLRFTLNEAARVVVRVERATAGRRSRGRCVRPTARLRRAQRCTRHTGLGSLVSNGLAGPNVVAVPRRIARRPLGSGKYRATIVATDASGNASTPKRLTFRIRAGARP